MSNSMLSINDYLFAMQRAMQVLQSVPENLKYGSPIDKKLPYNFIYSLSKDLEKDYATSFNRSILENLISGFPIGYGYNMSWLYNKESERVTVGRQSNDYSYWYSFISFKMGLNIKSKTVCFYDFNVCGTPLEDLFKFCIQIVTSVTSELPLSALTMINHCLWFDMSKEFYNSLGNDLLAKYKTCMFKLVNNPIRSPDINDNINTLNEFFIGDKFNCKYWIGKQHCWSDLRFLPILD